MRRLASCTGDEDVTPERNVRKLDNARHGPARDHSSYFGWRIAAR